MQLHDDIAALQKGLNEALAIMNSEPEVNDFKAKGKGGKLDQDAWSKATDEFNARRIEWGRKNLQPLALAGARVLGQFFLDIHSIADGVNK